jgi:diaminohydroxyphosphoribosylaminopyrimidine deaminase / 5-amino-6-(5-phosphoribosylamino)uracil reductase
MLNMDEIFMQRCFELAESGGFKTRPNPNVGALLVHGDIIIGEGWHRQYGKAHAEVNAINSVPEHKKHLISDSSLYVSLEPCNIYGKTPPCSELIISNNIKKVVISALDPNPLIAGKSAEFLKSKGINVTVGILEEKGKELIKVFHKNILYKRPYVILKYAKSKDNFIGNLDAQVKLTGKVTDIFTHQLRDDSEGIMIGTKTALTDNPSLTTRYDQGRNPVRIVLDRILKIPKDYKIFHNTATLILLNELKDEVRENVIYKKMDFSQPEFIESLLEYLFEMKIYQLIVEGGAELLNSFIRTELWDEALIIETPIILGKGIKAPELSGKLARKMEFEKDVIFQIKR